MTLIYMLFLSMVRPIFASNVKTIKLCENAVATAYISHQGTILEFPTEPEKVVLGTKGSFNVQYIKSDLAVSPSTGSSKSNLFVYLQGRRFALNLVASSSNGVTLYFIKDCLEDKVRTKKNGR